MRLNARHMRTWFGGTWLDPVSSGFNSTGTRLLLSPYPNDADTLCLVDWPSLHEVSSLSRDQFTDAGGIGESALPAEFDEIDIALLQPIRPGRVAVTIHSFATTILVLDF